MNDDFDSMNDLDSILAEFGGSAPQEEAPAAPTAAEELPPQPVVEPEVQEEKADGNTHLWRSRRSDRSRASGEEADADALSRERRARPGEAE